MYYAIYQITNTLNSKIYVGYHSTENLMDNYFGSGKILKRAIKKYGIENFKKEILYVFPTKKEALQKERELVNEDFIARKDTYNLKLGGEGGWEYAWNSPKRRLSIKQNVIDGKHRGWPISQEQRKRIGSVSFKGHHHSIESRKKISDAGKIDVVEFERRLTEYREIEKKFGWITKLAKSWRISNTQVTRFIQNNFKEITS